MSSTSKTGSPAMKQLQSLPGLKLKTFSKMSADSRNQVLEKTGSTVTGSDSDIIMVEGEPETAPAPSMPPLAMSITKVKKPAMPSLPRGTLITLPGAPTTGPPPPARSHPTATPPARQPIVQQPNIHNPGGVSITSLGAAPMRNPRMGGPSPPSLSRSPATPQLKNLNDVDFLRPTKQTQLPCSIHCLGVTGIPSLSCTACHCLYHPKCVGLGGLPQSLFNSKPFYCNDCTPPPDNIGPVSAPKYGKGSAAPIPATAQTNLKQSPALSTPHRQQQPMSSSQANKVAESQKPPKSKKIVPSTTSAFPGSADDQHCRKEVLADSPSHSCPNAGVTPTFPSSTVTQGKWIGQQGAAEQQQPRRCRCATELTETSYGETERAIETCGWGRSAFL